MSTPSPKTYITGPFRTTDGGSMQRDTNQKKCRILTTTNNVLFLFGGLYMNAARCTPMLLLWKVRIVMRSCFTSTSWVGRKSYFHPGDLYCDGQKCGHDENMSHRKSMCYCTWTRGGFWWNSSSSNDWYLPSLGLNLVVPELLFRIISLKSVLAAS